MMQGQFLNPILISDDLTAVESIFAADLDSDGDMDIVTSSGVADAKIVWHENLDGEGTFASQQVISTQVNGNGAVSAADLDGDGDMDVLSASEDDNKVAWYENLNGQGNFGAQQILTSIAFGAFTVQAVDLDGDNDLDVLASSNLNGKVFWFENIDGAATFGPLQLIVDTSAVYSAIAADLDGDEDLDVVYSDVNPQRILWIENEDGLGSFGMSRIITEEVSGTFQLFATDLNGNNQIDVLSASLNDDTVAWYENTDGLGIFGPIQVISNTTDIATCVYAADLDNDGSKDVLTTSDGNGTVSWFQNTDGLGTFGPEQPLSQDLYRPREVLAADINGNGVMDVVAAGGDSNGSYVIWYENIMPLGVQDNELNALTLYPNPTTGMVAISTNNIMQRVEVFTALGQLALTFKHTTQLDLTSLSAGHYVVKLIDNNEHTTIKRLIKN